MSLEMCQMLAHLGWPHFHFHLCLESYLLEACGLPLNAPLAHSQYFAFFTCCVGQILRWVQPAMLPVSWYLCSCIIPSLVCGWDQ